MFYKVNKFISLPSLSDVIKLNLVRAHSLQDHKAFHHVSSRLPPM